MKNTLLAACLTLAFAGSAHALSIEFQSPHVQVKANLPADTQEGAAQTFKEFDNTVTTSSFNFITEKDGVSVRHYVEVQTVTDRAACSKLPFCTTSLDSLNNFKTLKKGSGLESAKLSSSTLANLDAITYTTEGPVAYTQGKNKLYRFMSGTYTQITPTTRISVVTEVDALKKTVDSNRNQYKKLTVDAAKDASTHITFKVLK